MTLRWLVDKSALARLGKPSVAQVLTPRIDAGQVGCSVVTDLEVGFSARSVADHDAILTLLERLVPVVMPLQAERLARDTQRRLVESGLHRSAGVADLLVASIAAAAGLIVLHYDRDFEVIASVTGQRTEWVVPQGSTS
jgi:hypothetical protein